MHSRKEGRYMLIQYEGVLTVGCHFELLIMMAELQ
jgi:hypothetical protein